MATLLLIEDDSLLAHILLNTFEEAGFDVFWTRNQDETLEALSNQEVQLILLDIRTPATIDGRELLRFLKFESEFQNVPIVALTDQTSIESVDDLTSLGASEVFLRQRVELPNLIEAINKLTRKLG